jgi:stage V sporulation protein D (sporulation-specific penicillin-binding protein)
MEDFGLLELTGIDMQGEANSIVWTKDYFTGIYGLASLAVASFGQTLKFTPIQLIRAYAAAINGGYVLEPYVVDRIVDGDGNVVESHDTTVLRQAVSEETSETVREILETNVSGGGTGKNAYVAGYRIGGKTGTSEKRDESTGDNIVSFMGFARRMTLR